MTFELTIDEMLNLADLVIAYYEEGLGNKEVKERAVRKFCIDRLYNQIREVQRKFPVNES